MKTPALRRPLVWLLATLLWPGLLRAQEVLVGPLTTYPEQGAFDQPPAAKKKLAPAVPREMKTADEINYVMVHIYLDDQGKNRSRWVYGTVHLYKRAVDDAMDGWKIQPAQRANKPVDSRLWFPVIFNPASSAANLPDATPRLLEVTPIVMAAKEPEDAVIVPVTLTVNPQGQPEEIAVSPRFAMFRAEVEKGVAGWKFSPARKDGQPQAAQVRISVIVQPRPNQKVAKATPPALTRPVEPIYPAAMAHSGLRGEVAIEFTVSREGVVTEARVMESNNPGFNEAALEAIRKWKFKPARLGSEAIDAKMRQLIVFQMPYGGTDAFTVERNKPKKGMPPPANQPDVSAKPRGVVLPVYPYELLRSRTKGSAEVRMILNERGDVVEVTIVKSTHPEFGLALAAAVQAYAFNPALKAGKPVPSALGMVHEFKPAEIVSDDELDLLNDEAKGDRGIVSPTKLSDVPKAISQIAPAYPPEFAATGETGEAVVEFLIDHKGRPRLPRVLSATKPGFGYAAVQAVYAWRFEEPRINGKSVVLRVRMPLVFKPAGK